MESRASGTAGPAVQDGNGLAARSTSGPPGPAVLPRPLTIAHLAEQDPQLGEAVLNFCRRGAFALVVGQAKVGKTEWMLRVGVKKAHEGRRVLIADFENGPALILHRLRRLCGEEGKGKGEEGKGKGEEGKGVADLENLHVLDCRAGLGIDHIAAAMRTMGGCDVLFIDCWGLLAASDGLEDENCNSSVGRYFFRVRRTLAEFDAATVILHHTAKSGGEQPLCFAPAGASALSRYVSTIARIHQDASGRRWFNAVCREFDGAYRSVPLG